MAAGPDTVTDIPRVLILSDEGPQTSTAGGLLLHRLFADFPADRLRVLTRYVPTVGDPLPGVAYRRLTPPWQRFEKSRFHRAMRSMRAFGLVPETSLREIDRLLEGFVPDVVFCVMQHAAFYDAAAHFARSRRVPLVVAVHDVNAEFEEVYPFARRAAQGRDGAFYRFASRRLCISPEMERFCFQCFGAPGSVLYPNRSEGLEPRPLELSGDLRRGPALSVGFAGNLNYGYGEGILQMLAAVRAAGARLVLYGHPPAGAAAPLASALDCCEFRGFVTSDKAWEGLKRDCDAVWLPYPNPAGRMERLYRHHFPSKLPEYLALGMPVIVTGPDFATGFTWARRNLGPELCPGDAGELESLLRRLAGDRGLRLNAAAKGLEAGGRDFDPQKIKSEFFSHLSAAVAGAGS